MQITTSLKDKKGRKEIKIQIITKLKQTNRRTKSKKMTRESQRNRNKTGVTSLKDCIGLLGVTQTFKTEVLNWTHKEM